MSDPNMQWNGQQWMRWDGQQWVVAEPSPPERDGKNSNTVLIVIAAALGAVLVILLIAIVLLATRSNSSGTGSPGTGEPSPTPTVSRSSPSATPTPEQTHTLYFVDVESRGIVWAGGVKSTGPNAYGFIAQLRTEDLSCFRGTVQGNSLVGQVIPIPAEGQTPTPFDWTITGQGENLRLVKVGEMSGWREVPLVTVNDYAGLGQSNSWDKAFASCDSALPQ